MPTEARRQGDIKDHDQFSDEGRYGFWRNNRYAVGVAFSSEIGLSTRHDRRTAEETEVELLTDDEILEVADAE